MKNEIKTNGLVSVDMTLFTEMNGKKGATGIVRLHTPSNDEANSPYKNTEHSSLQIEFENKVNYDTAQYIIECHGLTNKMEGKRAAKVSITNVPAYYFKGIQADGREFYGVRVFYGEDLEDISNVVFLSATNIKTLAKRKALDCFEYCPDYDKSAEVVETTEE